MNRHLKNIFLIALILFSSIIICGCDAVKKTGNISPDINSAEWESILETGSNAKITVYHDISEKKADKWLKEVYVPSLKEKYGIIATVEMLDYEDFYHKISSEKKNMVNNGSIDIFLFEKSYFHALKKNGLLYGPFVQNLNNHHKYQNPDDMEVRYCGGKPSNGYAMLFGRNQTFLIFDKERMDSPPKSPKEMVNYLKFTKKRVDYPNPTNKIGQDFVNTIMASNLAYSEIIALKNTGDVRRKCSKGIKLLREMNRYTPSEGKAFSNIATDVEIEFNTKVIDFSMTRSIDRVSSGVSKNQIPSGSKAFVFNSGTTGSAFYGIIPYNAPNKAASMLALDFLISPAMQYSKYDIHNWGNLYGIDINMLSDDMANKLRKNDLLAVDMDAEKLLKHRIPQIPDRVSKLFYRVWKTDVKR